MAGQSLGRLPLVTSSARSAGEAGSAQCAAIRRLIPWSDVAIQLGRVS